jgi:hypothetical protein
LYRKTANPKERIAERKTKIRRRHHPTSQEKLKSSKPLNNSRQVDDWKTDTAGFHKLQDNMQNVPLLFTTPRCKVCVNFHWQGVYNANVACRFKASYGPFPTAVHQAYKTWQKDNRATA